MLFDTQSEAATGILSTPDVTNLTGRGDVLVVSNSR